MNKDTHIDGELNPRPPAVTGRILRANQKSNKRIALTMLGVLMVPILVVLAIHFFQTTQKHTRSTKLVSNIANLKKNVGCDQGVKQLGNTGSQLSDSSQYTNTASEQGLDYLMHCELIAGNVKQSLAYADQLNNLYKQEGNTQKQQQLAQTINYIKSFEGP